VLCRAQGCGGSPARPRSRRNERTRPQNPSSARTRQGSSDKIHDTLRAVAGALERGSWDVLRALLSAHSSDQVGPYFFPAIAQQGKMGDLEEMAALIDQVGVSNPSYLMAQISSAQVSAALTGQVDMLIAFERMRGAPPGAGGGRDGEKGGKGKGGGGGGDRSEL
jgi:hypothetical protein